jgi:transposase
MTKEMTVQSSMPGAAGLVTGGVDTHKDIHVAAALDQRGALLGTETFPATAGGYVDLAGWLVSFGPLDRVGVEGTSSWGAGLARYLASVDVTLVEVNRPNRQRRRVAGKSDEADAIAAARATQAGEATAIPKRTDGPVESIRVLRTTRSGAIRARTQAANQIHSLVDTCDETLRAELRGRPVKNLVTRLLEIDLDGDLADPRTAATRALVSLAHRWRNLNNEINQLSQALDQVIADHAPPELLAEFGIGTDVAAALVIAAGDNPHRIETDAGYAALCGTSPVDASSGRQQRHRLNRGGDRQANNALWRIVMVRIRHHHPATMAYIERRTTEGKTQREIFRCLKRYLARRIWRILTAPPNTTTLETAP